MSDARDALIKTASAVRNAVAEAADQLGDAAAVAAEKAGDAAAPMLKETTDRLSATAKDPQSMEELVHLVEAAVVELSDAVSLYARQEPIKSVLWAAAAGALAMALIRRATQPLRPRIKAGQR